MTQDTATKQFQSSALAQKFAVIGSLETLKDIDFTKGYEMDRRLKADTNLLAEFVKNPEEVAKREVGLEVPPGFHMHFVNEKNEYMPPEADALSQLSLGEDGRLWSRIEIRTAVGPGCYVFCGVCDNSGGAGA
jgi:hypothetical protein